MLKGGGIKKTTTTKWRDNWIICKGQKIGGENDREIVFCEGKKFVNPNGDSNPFHWFGGQCDKTVLIY